MNKLEQAARHYMSVFGQALEAHGIPFSKDQLSAESALREALDHSGEADEMVVGWDRVKPEAIASDPLYQQGFVDGVEEGRNQVAEQAEQEPVAHMYPSDLEKFETNETYAYAYSVAVGNPDERSVPLYAAPVRTKDLTDDEIWEVVKNCPVDNRIEAAKAGIAADRELNK